VNEATAYLSPALDVVAADDNDIRRDSQISQGPMQADRLFGLIGNFGLDDKKVDIAMGSGGARCV